ncbi:hypothetical protein EC988_010270 [Linderina pennispora]|nr:hypothetical protein EC988_010270 [Linderina pennispora]
MDELGDEEMQINAFNRMPLGRTQPQTPKPTCPEAGLPAPVYHRLSGLGICDGDDVVAWVRDSRLRRSWLLTGCPICLEQFQNHQLIRQLACGHPFHAMCIDRWFAQSKQPVLTCPLCLTPDDSAVHV